VDSTVIAMVSQYRTIMGMTFDPMDVSDSPAVYITTNYFFHGGIANSSGNSINADVRKVTGPNLETVTPVITGLPVSDHDHGTSALEWGNNGELYVNTGSNTNGGKPGELSGSNLQTESFLSAATLVFRKFFAHDDPGEFDGAITYTADNDGVVASGDVEIFATGLRNPVGLGKLQRHLVNDTIFFENIPMIILSRLQP